MKKQTMMLFLSMFCMTMLFAQDGGRFFVTVNKGTILKDNAFQVKFSIENIEDAKFTAPVFDDFEVLQGPNRSSMVTVMNGNASQRLDYTYYLKATKIGEFFIAPAKVETKKEDIFTEPLKITVVDNPEGIIEDEEPSISTFGFQMSPDDFGGINIQDFFTNPDGIMQDFGFDLDTLSNFGDREFNNIEDLFKEFQQNGIPGLDFEQFFRQIPKLEDTPEEEESTKKKKRKIYKI